MPTLTPESPFKPGWIPVDQLQGQFGWDLPYGGHAPPPTPEPLPHRQPVAGAVTRHHGRHLARHLTRR